LNYGKGEGLRNSFGIETTAQHSVESGESGFRKVAKEKIREKAGRFRLVRSSVSDPFSLNEKPDPGFDESGSGSRLLPNPYHPIRIRNRTKICREIFLTKFTC
jgi:hypothetical protein